MILKPCPFCGEKVKLELTPMFGSDSTEEFWSIHCECPMGTTDAIYGADEKQELIDAWNRRIG